MAQQRVTHRIQQRPQGRVVRFHAPQPAVANLVIEQTQIVQRKRRRLTVPQVDNARIPFLIFAKKGLLRLRQRGKQLRQALDPVPDSEPGRHHDFPEARVSALPGALRLATLRRIRIPPELVLPISNPPDFSTSVLRFRQP